MMVGRRERHDVERLTPQHGWDAKLTDLLTTLTRTALSVQSVVSMIGAGRFIRRGDNRVVTAREPNLRLLLSVIRASVVWGLGRAHGEGICRDRSLARHGRRYGPICWGLGRLGLLDVDVHPWVASRCSFSGY
jgi:hypothetical protein